MHTVQKADNKPIQELSGNGKNQLSNKASEINKAPQIVKAFMFTYIVVHKRFAIL